MQQVDLINLVEHDLGQGKKSGKWTLFKCPFHADHTPSLGVTNGNDSRGPFWECFSCGKKGDCITWLMEYRGMAFPEAKKVLTGNLPGPNQYQKAQEPPPPPPDEPPGPQWQTRANALIERAEDSLWSNKGAFEPIEWLETDTETGQPVRKNLSPLDWLLSRGLAERAIRAGHIGYIPSSWNDKPSNWGLNCTNVFIHQGILIPCIIRKNTWYLKVRCPEGKPHKYTQVPGGKAALYMADQLETQDIAIFCEGEFDALLLWQEIGYMAGTVTLGSATKDLNPMPWGLYLLGVSRKYCAYDLDEAGQSGSHKLDKFNVKRLTIPKIKPFDKDITDFYRSGGDLGDWFKSELRRTNILE